MKIRITFSYLPDTFEYYPYHWKINNVQFYSGYENTSRPRSRPRIQNNTTI